MHSRNRSLAVITVTLISGLLIQPPLAAAAALNKCVDDKGRTQYYDKVLPPECQGKATVEMSSRGVVKKKNEVAEGPMSVEEQAKRKAEEQKVLDAKRRDTALTSTYTNEKEIDLARDRNVQPVELTIKGIEPRLKTAQSRLDGLRQQAADAEKAKSPMLASIKEDVVTSEREVKRLQDELANRQKDLENIKARFEADKKRFQELKQGKS